MPGSPVDSPVFLAVCVHVLLVGLEGGGLVTQSLCDGAHFLCAGGLRVIKHWSVGSLGPQRLPRSTQAGRERVTETWPAACRSASCVGVWVCVWGRESEWECGCLHEFVGDCLMCQHVLGAWKLKAEALYNSHTALITFIRLKLTNWTSKVSLMSHYNRQILNGSTFL